ncbi:MAG: hypothetical protein AB7G62_06650 [Magnetospirillum sp.]
MTHPMTEICETMMAQGSSVGPQLAKGAVMSAGVVAGRSVLGRLLTNPLVLLAAGAAAGYYGYKYRKEIAAALAKGTDMGKDMVLNARESLADLVEEAREAEDSPAKASE